MLCVWLELTVYPDKSRKKMWLDMSAKFVFIAAYTHQINAYNIEKKLIYPLNASYVVAKLCL